MNLAPKTIGATAGASAGGGLSISVVSILDWILSFWNVSMTPTVAASFATVFAAVFAFLGAYFSPHSHPPPPTDSVALDPPPKPEVDRF